MAKTICSYLISYHSYILNTILVLVTLSGLAYQSLELLEKFMEKKTIVNIQFEMLSEHDHPAISVCFDPGTFTPFHLAQIDKEFAIAFDEWENLVMELQNYYNETGDLAKIPKPRIQHSFKKTLKLSNNLRFNYSLNQFDFDTILSNYSITRGDIGLSIIVDEQFVTNTKSAKLSSQHYKQIANDPIERFDGRSEKCFTYFSMVSLNRTRLVVRDMYQITLIIIPRTNHYGLGLLPRIRLSLHSSNIAPSLDKSMIEITSRSIIYFSQTVIDRYLSGYDTDCYDYNYGEYTSRHDCLVNCLYHLNNGTFYNRHSIIEIDKNNIGDFILGEIEHVDDRCKKKCKIECESTYYRFDQVDRRGAQVFSAEDNSNILQSYARGMNLTSHLRHSSTPDLVVHHFPEVNLLSLMCNFGGLLGMWTGLSILIICRRTFSHLRHLLLNFQFYWIKLKNTLTFNSTNVIVIPKLINNQINTKNYYRDNRQVKKSPEALFIPFQVFQNSHRK